MSGRMGYGWALMSRESASSVADWQPLVVEPEDSVLDISERSLARQQEKKYDYIIVNGASWRVLSTGDIINAYSSMVTNKLKHDILTGLLERSEGIAQFDKICQAAQRHNARANLSMIKLRGLKKLNKQFGLNYGDQVIQAVAASLLRWAGSNYSLCRITGNTIVVMNIIVGMPLDTDAITTSESIKNEALDVVNSSLGGITSSFPAQVREFAASSITASAVSVCSREGTAHPDALLIAATERLTQPN